MSSETLQTREITEADAEVVAQFVWRLLDELSDGAAPEQADVLAVAHRTLLLETVTGLLAYSGEVPVGLMMLNECAAIYAGGRFAEISELYVEPELRSHGVAASLVHDAIELGKARDWQRLEVGAPDQPAWKRTFDFYLGNGFAEVGPRLRRLI